jgi:asparagine synthase (glutamine-hydrolysing)
MCGINGFSGSDRLLIEKMNAVTRNRGPDDTGTYVDEKVTLGHNRLSIIDLSDNGHQPMANEDETVWISYNGEVYNFEEIRRELLERGHRFRSNTDTEVIVHAYEEYGYDFVRRFNGMWAFCIYDKHKNELILSRDQFGIKPLYYYMDDGRIIFSSMIGGILCHDVKTAPNDRAIMEYLAFNLEDHDRYTFFENIYTLSPDSLLIYSLTDHSHRFHRWYDLEKCAGKGGDIRELFIESVKLRTIADVPIGSCLSGGVDSSAIVCVLDRILPDRFSTYSLISPGSRLDESRYIKEVGKVTRTEQHFTTIDRADVLSDLRDFIAAQEEPVTGLSPYAQYRVMKLAHENKAKVLLDGQGGDELFAGYVYYYGYYYYELLKKLKLYTLAREMVCYRLNFKNFYPHRMLFFMLLPGSVKSGPGSRVIGKWVSLPYLKKICGDSRDPRWEARDLRSALTLTIRKTAIPHLLRWEDKNSMRWSIETRPPFLDVNLMEAALSMAPGENLKNGRTKAGFRQAVRDILPPAIMDRKDKIGFAAPGNELFRDKDMVSFCREVINSADFKGRPYWDSTVVRRMFNDHVKGEIDIGDTIWKWINLELWLREYFGGRRPAAVQVEQKIPLKPIPLAKA